MTRLVAASVLGLIIATGLVLPAYAEVPSNVADDTRVVDAVALWKEWVAYQAAIKLKKTGEHTFRRIREDSDQLGESFVFEVGSDGTATRFKQHSNWANRVPESLEVTSRQPGR